MVLKDPLTIVHVVRQFHPGVGGLENYVEQLAAHQRQAGHKVRVVTLDRVFEDPSARRLREREEHLGVEIVRLSYFGSSRYPVAPGILRAIRGCDLVHVHAVDFFCDFLAATAWLHRKPLVLTTHGGYFHTKFASRLKKIYFASATRLALTQYGAVIAASDEDYRTFSKVSGSRLKLILNPVDIHKFANLADSESANIIYFGRLAPNKELVPLIDWFAGLCEQDSRFKLIVAGKPMGTSTAELRSHADARALGDHVEIHELPSDDELRHLIGRSSIYCCASSYEGFGLAAVEAASAGLYPVLSNIPPFAQTLKRLGFGMIVNFADRSTWRESYGRLIELSGDFHRRFKSEQVIDAVAPFAWPAAIPLFEDVYQRVLGRTVRRIGQVNLDVLDQTTGTEKILTYAAEKQPAFVTFCNAHTSNLASKNDEFRRAIEKALVLNDGVGVDLASRLLFGSSFPDNLNGTDFVPHLLAAAEQPLRLFLIGGAEGVAEAAGRNLVASNSMVEIAGTMHGFFSASESAKIVQSIKESGANMILVAMGQPQQELWASEHYVNFSGPTICVGALLDFLAGRVPRAPALMRRARLEWAFRLAVEPSRLWRRYLVGNLQFVLRIVAQRIFGGRL